MISRLSFAKRMMFASGLVLLLTAIQSTVSLYTNSMTRAALNLMNEDSLPGVYEIGKLSETVGHIRVLTMMHVAAKTPADKAPFASEIAQREPEFRDHLKRYESTITTDRDRQLFHPIPPAFDDYIASVRKVVALSDAMHNDEAAALYTRESRPLVLKLIRAISDEVEFNKESGDRYAATATTSAQRAQTWTWILLFVTLLVGGGTSVIILKSLNHSLRLAVRELGAGADEISAAAAQVATSSQALAQGASEQAPSIGETSTSSDQITSMTKKNDENAQPAPELVHRVENRLTEGNRVLDEMVVSMQAISGSSQKISHINK